MLLLILMGCLYTQGLYKLVQVQEVPITPYKFVCTKNNINFYYKKDKPVYLPLSLPEQVHKLMNMGCIRINKGAYTYTIDVFNSIKRSNSSKDDKKDGSVSSKDGKKDTPRKDNTDKNTDNNTTTSTTNNKNTTDNTKTNTTTNTTNNTTNNNTTDNTTVNLGVFSHMSIDGDSVVCYYSHGDKCDGTTRYSSKVVYTGGYTTPTINRYFSGQAYYNIYKVTSSLLYDIRPSYTICSMSTGNTRVYDDSTVTEDMSNVYE